MTATTLPNPMMVDEDLCELIAHDTAARRQSAEANPTSEFMRLLRMARPDLDGDEQAAIERLKAALIEEEMRG
jgi:hypothetical protein